MADLEIIKPEEGIEIEIQAEPKENEAAAAAEVPTLEDLAKQGFQGQELETAKEMGLATEKKEEPKPKTKVEPKKEGEPEPKKEEKPEDKKPTKEEIEAAWKLAQVEDDPAKEQEKLKAFDLNAKQLYKAQKLAKSRARAAEAERDQAALRARTLEEENKKLREQIEKAPPELDEEGNPIKKEPPKKADPTEEERKAQERVLNVHLAALEDEARAEHEDFDEVVTLAQEILVSNGAIFGDDKKTFSKSRKLFAGYLELVANPARPGEFNAADAMYEFGKLHPKYGAKAKGNADPETEDEEPKTQVLDPKKIEKVKEQAKRQPSAALPTGGGNKRIVRYEDMTTEQILALPPEKFDALPEHIKRKHAGG